MTELLELTDKDLKTAVIKNALAPGGGGARL